GILQGVGQDGQAVVGTVVVDGLRQLRDRGILPGKPEDVDGEGAEAVADEVTQQVTLPGPLHPQRGIQLALTALDSSLAEAKQSRTPPGRRVSGQPGWSDHAELRARASRSGGGRGRGAAS